MNITKDINDMTIEERAKAWETNNGTCITAMTKVAENGYIKGATEQKDIDIERIPQLYVRWLMIDGEKPAWKEYVIKAMEE